jgi:hypothetical protein
VQADTDWNAVAEDAYDRGRIDEFDYGQYKANEGLQSKEDFIAECVGMAETDIQQARLSDEGKKAAAYLELNEHSAYEKLQDTVVENAVDLFHGTDFIDNQDLEAILKQSIEYGNLGMPYSSVVAEQLEGITWSTYAVDEIPELYDVRHIVMDIAARELDIDWNVVAEDLLVQGEITPRNYTEFQHNTGAMTDTEYDEAIYKVEVIETQGNAHFNLKGQELKLQNSTYEALQSLHTVADSLGMEPDQKIVSALQERVSNSQAREKINEVVLSGIEGSTMDAGDPKNFNKRDFVMSFDEFKALESKITETHEKESYALTRVGVMEFACEDAHKAAGVARTGQDNTVIRSQNPEAFDNLRANRYTPTMMELVEPVKATTPDLTHTKDTTGISF